MLHSFSRNHHHHHYFKYNRIKEKEDLDGRTQIQIYNIIHVNTLRIFEVVHLWIILNWFIIGVIHIHAVISDRWLEQRAIPHWPSRGRSQINRTFTTFARDSPLSEGKWSKFNWYARIFNKSVMIISFRNWMKYIDV